MLTLQVLTRDNIGTIRSCLESAGRAADEIVVGDFGSKDGTREACEDFGARVVDLKFEGDMSEARNSLLAPGRNMYLEPWEFISRGHSLLSSMGGVNAFYVVQGGFISKQVRLWEGGRFVNPVFERLAGAGEAVVRAGVVISSRDPPDSRSSNTEACRAWAARRPTSPEPHYYLACSLLAEGKTDEFFNEAVRYLSMDREGGESSLLMNYYLARVEASRGMFKEASRRAVACLSLRPAFAEFWCLLGDMLYARGRFDKAKDMYENARIIGSRRVSDDTFPIEVCKYGDYPISMEEKCSVMARRGLVVGQNRTALDR